MAHGLGLVFMGMGLGMALMAIGYQIWKDARERMVQGRKDYLRQAQIQAADDDTLVLYNLVHESTVYQSKGQHVAPSTVSEIPAQVKVWTQTQIEIVWVTVKREVPKAVETVAEVKDRVIARVQFLLSELCEWWAVQGPDRSEGLTEEVLSQLRIPGTMEYDEEPVALTRVRKEPMALPAGPIGIATMKRRVRERLAIAAPPKLPKLQMNESLMRIPMYVSQPRNVAMR